LALLTTIKWRGPAPDDSRQNDKYDSGVQNRSERTAVSYCRTLRHREPGSRSVHGRRAKEIASDFDVPYVFKASFDKANRTSINSFRGPGMDEGLKLLGEVRKTIGVPILTDVHLPEQAAPIAKVVDILQIPCVSVQADRPHCCCCKDGQNCERQEGPVPGAVGNEKRGGQSARSGELEYCSHRTRRIIWL
jgi:hypothetical protein